MKLTDHRVSGATCYRSFRSTCACRQDMSSAHGRSGEEEHGPAENVFSAQVNYLASVLQNHSVCSLPLAPGLGKDHFTFMVA